MVVGNIERLQGIDLANDWEGIGIGEGKGGKLEVGNGGIGTVNSIPRTWVWINCGIPWKRSCVSKNLVEIIHG